jgi:hypothetical protein
MANVVLCLCLHGFMLTNRFAYVQTICNDAGLAKKVGVIGAGVPVSVITLIRLSHGFLVPYDGR